MAGTGPWLAEGQVIWAGGPYKSDMDISKRRDEALMIQQEPGQSGCTADKLKLGVSPDRKPAYKVIAGIALPPLCARTPGPADRLEGATSSETPHSQLRCTCVMMNASRAFAEVGPDECLKSLHVKRLR